MPESLLMMVVAVTATDMHSEVLKCEEVEGVKGARASVVTVTPSVWVCKFPGASTLAYTGKFTTLLCSDSSSGHEGVKPPLSIRHTCPPGCACFQAEEHAHEPGVVNDAVEIPGVDV